MQKTIKKFVLLLALVCATICCVAFVACGDSGNGDGEQKVTYTVTVTCSDEFDFTTVTAQWKSGDTVKDSAKLDANGKASVSLEKGNYTVTLTGTELENYKFTPASVTETNRNANIALINKADLITYTVTVEYADLDPTTITAKWLVGATEMESKALNEDGEASVELEKGDYTVTLSGVPEFGYAFEPATVTEDSFNAEITITKTFRSVPVTVNVPEGVTLAKDVKVQVYVDEAEYGEPVAISQGMVVAVPLDGEFTVELINLPSYLVQTTSKTDDSITIDVNRKSFSYEVTVTCGDNDFNFTDITVYIGEEDFALGENHKVTATLPAKEYDVRLEGFNEKLYSYAPAKLTEEIHSVTIDVKTKSISLAPNGTAEIVFSSAEDEITVKLINVENGKTYALELTSEEGDETADNIKNYNFYVVYGEQNDTLGKDKFDNDEESFMIIEITEERLITITADGFFGKAVTVSLKEYEKPIDPNIELNVDKEIIKTANYTFTAPQYGNYKIEVTGANRDDFGINIGDGLIMGKTEVPGEGMVDSGNANLYYEFFAEQDEEVSVSVYLNTDSITLKITHLPDGDFTLGEEKEVELHTSTYTKKEYQFIAPAKAVYKLEILSHTSSQVYVRDEGANESVIDFMGAGSSGTFQANKDETVRLGFYQVNGATTCTAIITLEEVLPDVLKVGGEAIETKFGDIVVEGLKADRDYTVTILLPPRLGSAAGTAKLTYNNQEYPLLFSDEVGDLNQYATFTAVKDVNIITISINALSGSNSDKFTISIAEVTAAGPSGPAVGESASFTINNKGIGNAAELTFSENFVAGGIYTLHLIPVGQGWNITSYKLVYDSQGSEVEFTSGEGYLEATFTANANTNATVKVYHEDPYMTRAVEGSVEIAAVVLPGAGPSGPAVGESASFTINNKGIGNAAELTFSENFVAGGIYTLHLIPVGQGWNITSYKLVYDSQGSEVEFTSGEGYLEATFTANANTNATVKVYHEDPYMTRAVEGSVEIAAVVLPGAGSAGPQVGDSDEVFIKDKANAVNAPFEFVEGKTYTLSLVPEVWRYDFYLLVGSTEIKFDYPAGSSDHLEATFTATAETVKLFLVNMSFGASESNATISILDIK